MPERLRNRQMQIPGGLGSIFYDAPQRWKPPQPMMSLDSIAGACQAKRLANPGVTAQFKQSTNIEEIKNEIDYHAAAYCKKMGWHQYYLEADGGAPSQVPFPYASQGQRNQPLAIPSHRKGPASRISAVGAGAKTIVEWIASGAEAVPQELANKRAATCAQCPYNVKADGWESWFTTETSNAIRSEMQKRREWKLTTNFDEAIQTCGLCLCPLHLAVHCPLETKLKHMPEYVKESLPNHCWQKTECAPSSNPPKSEN